MQRIPRRSAWLKPGENVENAPGAKQLMSFLTVLELREGKLPPTRGESGPKYKTF